jgi:NADH-quinone oxidoreductase subunit C
MFEKILKIVSDTARQLTPVVDENATPRAIRIHADDLLPVCHELFKNPQTYFDMLSCVTGIDNGPAVGTIEIAYNLYSIPYNLHLMLKVSLPRDNGEVDSLSGVWKTANWHEREIFDMFGVTFKNHPDLRRILLPADWEGHPLRKDYKQQEYYKKIKVDY